MQRFFTNSFVGLLIVITSGLTFSFLYAQAVESSINNEKIIYSSKDIESGISSLISLKTGTISNDLKLREDKSLKQKIFLSPNRKYLAVTFEKGDHSGWTYIADINGNILVQEHLGVFKSWLPDSEGIILYLSVESTGSSRQMYYLDLNRNYRKLDLPDGVFSADISPVDGSVAYSLTDSVRDDTELHIVNSNGQDKLIVGGNEEIISWPRWSSDGNKIIYMKSGLRAGLNKEVWVINLINNENIKVSNIQWNYPAVLSPDGTKFVFANAGNIWEYHLNQNILIKVTNVDIDFIQHPNYSADGETIVFSNGEQIWSTKGGVTRQLTSGGGGLKSYPILP
jgi:Tol biopolymer transport system component